MKKLKVMFLIHDLGQGGAEKVLVNLVNNMNKDLFDVTVTALFKGGVNEQFLSPDITYKTVFGKMIRGNKHFMKLLPPRILHRMAVKETYDIEVSFLEGPSARVISGCSVPDTKKVSWIHVEQHTMKRLASSFQNEKEARRCYGSFDHTICVSEFVKNDFCSILDFSGSVEVLYNTVESEKILRLAQEKPNIQMNDNKIRLIAVGTLKESKGYTRLLRIIKRLAEQYPICLYILGAGPMESEIRKYIQENHLENTVLLLGYQTNPYKYVVNSDLFVCASFAEGFSTAVTESLILGTPVCTVEVSGMKELLGDSNEYGLVTANTEEALYKGIKKLMDNKDLLGYYAEKAKERGKTFETGKTVKAVEDMLIQLYGGYRA